MEQRQLIFVKLTKMNSVEFTKSPSVEIYHYFGNNVETTFIGIRSNLPNGIYNIEIYHWK